MVLGWISLVVDEFLGPLGGHWGGVGFWVCGVAMKFVLGFGLPQYSVRSGSGPFHFGRGAALALLEGGPAEATAPPFRRRQLCVPPLQRPHRLRVIAPSLRLFCPHDLHPALFFQLLPDGLRFMGQFVQVGYHLIICGREVLEGEVVGDKGVAGKLFRGFLLCSRGLLLQPLCDRCQGDIFVNFAGFEIHIGDELIRFWVLDFYFSGGLRFGK